MRMSVKNFDQINKPQGFTLVELLVVIAILGILAAAILVALDPTEQIARGKDSGRKTTLSQIGNALQSYYSVQASYPTVNNSWLTSLKNAGELKSVPSTETSAAGCSGGGLEAGYCVKVSGNESVIYVIATSKTEKVRATGTGAACAYPTYVVWSSSDGGKTGVWCAPAAATEPSVAALGSALK